MTDVKVMSVTFLLDVLEIVIDSVMDPTFHMTISHKLNSFQQGELLEVLKKFEDLFQGNLGVWPNTEIGATLVGGATPYHCQRPMRKPHAHYRTLKNEIDRLVSIGVLEEGDGNTAGPWCSPSFIIPKKDGTVRFITDYREVNRRIVRKP